MKNIHNRGFTLIEVLMVAAIIGILAMLAVPSYQEHVRKSRRSDAKILLISTAQQLERCYAECNAYNACAAGVTGCPVTFPVRSTDGGTYEITAADAIRAAHSFTLKAKPVAGKPQANDAKCTSFSLTHTGAKSAEGSAGSDCWK